MTDKSFSVLFLSLSPPQKLFNFRNTVRWELVDACSTTPHPPTLSRTVRGILQLQRTQWFCKSGLIVLQMLANSLCCQEIAFQIKSPTLWAESALVSHLQPMLPPLPLIPSTESFVNQKGWIDQCLTGFVQILLSVFSERNNPQTKSLKPTGCKSWCVTLLFLAYLSASTI
jgi:hypothetical protein